MVVRCASAAPSSRAVCSGCSSAAALSAHRSPEGQTLLIPKARGRQIALSVGATPQTVQRHRDALLIPVLPGHGEALVIAGARYRVVALDGGHLAKIEERGHQIPMVAALP